MLLLTTGAVGFSIYLTYVEARVLETYCIWCVTSAGIICAHRDCGHRGAVKREVRPDPKCIADKFRAHRYTLQWPGVTMSLLAEFVKQAALEEGFSLAGIAPAAPLGELDYFPAWIEAGYHGEMEYLAKTNDAGELRRAALANVAPWARSVVVCAANYNSATPYSTQCDDPARGWISRYAFVESDYHELLLARLRRVEQRMVERIVADGHASPRTWCYVDTGPVVERVLAAHSGIGWTGKNGCILNQQLGSWLFLGVILSSHGLPPDLPAADRCGSCTRCLDACPTQAFIAPRQLDARRCISYLTIEQRGAGAGRAARKDGTASVRLRYLPGRLPVESPRAGLAGPGLCAAYRTGQSLFGVDFRYEHGRVPAHLSRIAREARETQRTVAQRRHCHGQQRRPKTFAAPARAGAA